MGKIKRYRNVISRFISSEQGQRFFNFAYSIGAAIVIWGALFKILHLPGGNMLLSIGMGTEVLMFVLTAFDRPPKEYKWERVYPGLESDEERAERELAEAEEAARKGSMARQPAITGGGTIIIGGTDNMEQPTDELVASMQSISGEMEQLRDLTHRLNQVSSTLLESYRAITENSDNIAANSAGYVEQMQTLNRNIQGLNTIYEIQLKSVSSQLDAIDRVNRGIKEISDMYVATAGNSERYCAETEKMAENMKRLNSVYEKVLTAMTINMYPGMAAPQGSVTPPPMPTPNDQQ